MEPIVENYLKPPDADISFIPEKREDRDGDCYLLSGHFIMNNPDWNLVHATLYPRAGNFADKPYLHAFVEKDQWVFDPIFNEFYLAVIYYYTFRVTNPEIYTSDEAREMMLKTGTYGAW